MALDLDVSKLAPADILDLAIYAEREARDHYEQIADWLDARGNPEAAAFFRRMAGFEAKHERQLEAVRRDRYAGEPVRYTDSYAWEIEAPDYASLELDATTMARAIDTALGSEDSAYEFYDRVLAYVEDAETRALLQELRDAEAAHRRMLEAERGRLGA